MDGTNEGGKINTFIFGQDFDGTKTHLDLIACLFHWFGVSVYNYARLIGFMRGLSQGAFSRSDLGEPLKCKSISEVVDAYVNGIPELQHVRIWRHKVAAHFAITAPHKDDNIATLDLSVIFPVCFEKESLSRWRACNE